MGVLDDEPPRRKSLHAATEIGFRLIVFLACTREPVQTPSAIGIRL